MITENYLKGVNSVSAFWTQWLLLELQDEASVWHSFPLQTTPSLSFELHLLVSSTFYLFLACTCPGAPQTHPYAHTHTHTHSATQNTNFDLLLHM